jgi:glycosyltransferase involved in cell wall biosynthesis
MGNFSTIIIPAFNEGPNIAKTIGELAKLYGASIDVLIIVDFENDTTIESFNSILAKPKRMIKVW